MKIFHSSQKLFVTLPPLYLQIISNMCQSHQCLIQSVPVGVCICVTQRELSFLFEAASLVAQTVKRLSTVRETWVRALGWEDPLEKEMAIHSSTVAWKIPWTEEPGRLQSIGWQRVGHD